MSASGDDAPKPHPNIKVFIAHGGLIGTQEAIFNGVPMIGIPIYADQYNNLLQAQYLGFAKILEYHDLNEESLGQALNEMLTDDTYSKKAKELSVRFRDRPMSALDTAMYWIEYVIRNNGAEYLKNPALELSWLAYSMLDVYVFILVVVLTALYIVFKVFMILVSLIRPKNSKKQNKKKVT